MSDLIPRPNSDVVISDSVPLNFHSKLDEFIFKVIDSVKDQRKILRVPDTDQSSITHSMHQRLLEFGIAMNSDLVVETGDSRSYLLIVEPGWIQNLEERVDEFCYKYLPDESFPTHFVVRKQFESLEEYRMWLNLLQDLFPNITPLTDQSDVNEMERRVSLDHEIYNEIIEKGFTPYVLQGKFSELAKEHRSSNANTLRLFKELEQDILEFGRKNRNILLVPSNEYTAYAPFVCAYMFYKYGVNSHMDVTSTQFYLSGLSKLFYSENFVSLENRLRYIKGLPRVGLQFTPDLSMSNFVYIDKSSMKCKILFTCLPMDKDGDSEKIELDIRDVFLLSTERELELDATDRSEFRRGHRKALDLFVKLSESSTNREIIPTIFNTAVIELDGRKLLAYAENIMFSVQSLCIPTDSNLGRFTKELNEEDLKRLYPIKVLPGYKEILGSYMAEVIREIAREEGENASITSIGAFPKLSNPIGLVINELGRGKGIFRLNIDSISDHYLLGTWWGESDAYRTGLTKELQTRLSVTESRKHTSFFSVFGGPSPGTDEPLELQEGVLKSE